MTGTETFAALPPLPVSIDVGGERLELTPLKVGDVPAFARAVQSAAATLSASLSASPDWLALFADHGDAVIEAIAIAARRPRDWVMNLELDAAIRLADAVFEVNADFFIRRVAPALASASTRIGHLLNPTPSGPMPSSD